MRVPTDKDSEAIEIHRAFADGVVERLGDRPEALIPILQAIQKEYRYLPEASLRRVCEITAIAPATLEGVVGFYSQFRRKPIGRHLISVCHGTACHVKGAGPVHDALRRRLSLTGDADTDADGTFTIQKVACLGCCTLAPALQIDGVTYGHLTPETAPNALRDFLAIERKGRVPENGFGGAKPGERFTEIRIGVGSCCIAGGSLKVGDALNRTIREIGAPAVLKPVGCVGMCHQTPMVEVAGHPSCLYAKVTPGEAEKIIRRNFKPKGWLKRLRSSWNDAMDRLATDESWDSAERYEIDVRDAPVRDFLNRQVRIATENCGSLDPLDLEEYRSHEGFDGLRKVLDGHPSAAIENVEGSGLRGRGGAGFPTGRKWRTVRNAPGETKYILCNGDEGDPGAFMDRMILESFPYRVLEGMAIAAYAVGASEGILYIRSEYPLAVERIREAIRRCEAERILGEKILDTDFTLRLRVMEGAGAFVCGEETALIASIEGRRGAPRLRPPYPAESGLWGRPTSINNVETYALIPWIMRRGAAAFAAYGTERSKGTKVFALTGKIRRGGLIEVPMGITIREIVEEIGGGVPDGGRFKAAQIGGPSGGCIPASLAHTPIDYEELTRTGAIMGSGGLVVLDERTCMVDIARYFLEFTQNESCGKCSFCRIGTRRMLDLLERICEGRGKTGDLEKLEDLAMQVKRGSMCGLGQTAPNPVLTTLRYFREEYEAHLDGRCPAGKCAKLIRYEVADACIGCTKCAQECPVSAISSRPYERHVIDDRLCTRCDVCRRICPANAIRVT